MSTIKKLVAFAAIISASALFGQFNGHLYQDEISIAKQYMDYLSHNSGYQDCRVTFWFNQYTDYSYHNKLSATRLLEAVATISDAQLSEQQKLNKIYQIIETERLDSSAQLVVRAKADKEEDQKRQNKIDAEWRAQCYTQAKEQLIDAAKLMPAFLAFLLATACTLDMAELAYRYTIKEAWIKWLTAPAV